MFLLTFCAAILSTATEAVIQNHTQLYSTYRALKAHKVTASWDDADRTCRSEGAILASPITEDILKDMKHFLEANHENDTYFIGTRARQTPGQYVSIEGITLQDTPAFKLVEQLDVEEGDCLRINKHKISLVPCWTHLPYICRFNDTMPKNTTLSNTKLDNIMLNDTTSEITLFNDRISEIIMFNNRISNNTMMNNAISEITIFNNTISEITLVNNTISKITIFNNTISEIIMYNDTISDITMFNNKISKITMLNDKITRINLFNNTISEITMFNNTILQINMLNKTMLKNPVELSCPTEGYTYAASTDKCYKAYSIHERWYEAEEICVAEGGHLVVVNNETEAQIMSVVMTNIAGIWTGLRDNSGNGDWKSIDGIPVEKLFNEWYDGSKPTNHEFGCSFLLYDQKLANYGCDNICKFVCEKYPE